MIKRLDNIDKRTAEEIYELQQASYKIEAGLIGFEKLPPLLESPDDIRHSEEIFIGYYSNEKLAGLISYKLINGTLDIHKLAVHPDYFKRGIAKQLLARVESIQGIKDVIVCTGFKNTPAVGLYSKLGFTETGTQEVAEGIYIICFKKKM